MKHIIILSFLIAMTGCQREDVVNPDLKFTPSKIFVKTKGKYKINEVFNFINSFDHDVIHMSALTMTSDLPADSLQYILNYLNNKPYTTDRKDWHVNGRSHAQTKAITITISRLFDINNQSYQRDLFESMKILKLKEVTRNSDIGGYVILFYVPAGKEIRSIRKFLKHDIVDWAEPNYLLKVEI
jgi:hypothetical protein